MARNIHLLISTHQGVLYDEVCDYVVVSSKEGEFAIMHDHVALITTINEGYLKLVRENTTLFVAVVEGALMFRNNELSLVALEAFIGNTKKRAMELLLEVRADRLEQNRKVDTELELTERKLKENIKQAKAGSVV